MGRLMLMNRQWMVKMVLEISSTVFAVSAVNSIRNENISNKSGTISAITTI